MADAYFDKIRQAVSQIDDQTLCGITDAIDSVATSELDVSYGAVDMNSYLSFDDAGSVRVDSNSVRLAQEFMEALKEEKLIKFEGVVTLKKGEEGGAGDIMQLGYCSGSGRTTARATK